MRPYSVSAIKGQSLPSHQNVPRAGTQTRLIYDRLMAGEYVDIPRPRALYLQDFYGLEIEQDGPIAEGAKWRKTYRLVA